jgi:hypothetical protein
MQKWITDGLIVGLVTVTIGGGASILSPKNTGVTVLGSGLGAVLSSTILAKRQSQALTCLKKQLQNAKTSSQITQSKASNPALATPTQLAPLNQKQEARFKEGSLIQQPEAATTNYHSSAEELDSIGSQRQSEELAIDWLSSKKISVENHRTLDLSVDEIFNKQAIYLGDNLKDENRNPLLAPFLKQIKWSISQNRGVQYHLKNLTQPQIKILTQFCQNLHDDTLLSSYRYLKDEKIIHAVIQDRGDVRSFFNGNWFERFVGHKIHELLQKLNLPYTHLNNPIIKFPNGNKFELDLLFLVEGHPLLIECKTGGDFNAHLKKFSDHQRRLSISPERAFLVILDLENSQTERLSPFWRFKVVNQDQLVPLIQTVVQPFSVE